MELAIAVAVGLILLGVEYLLSDLIRYYGLKFGSPVVENPYGKDHTRDFPKRVRFLRLPVTSRFGKLKSAFAEMVVQTAGGDPVDCAGTLHWQRQPRSGKPHSLKLHQELSSANDVKDHMYNYHFSENEPVDIPRGEEDKIDLFMKIEDLQYAITTVSRENHLQPGIYHVEVKLTAENIQKPKHYKFKVEIGEGIEDLAVLA